MIVKKKNKRTKVYASKHSNCKWLLAMHED